jgi:ATP-dependent DNA ligase
VLIEPARPGGYVVKIRSGRVLTVPELGGLADLGVSAALDGELVTGTGRMDDIYAFAPALATRRRRTPVTFVAFDAVYVDGEDLTGRAHVVRRAVLEGLGFAGPAGRRCRAGRERTQRCCWKRTRSRTWRACW